MSVKYTETRAASHLQFRVRQLSKITQYELNGVTKFIQVSSRLQVFEKTALDRANTKIYNMVNRVSDTFKPNEYNTYR